MEERLKQSERRHRSLYAEMVRHRDALRILSTRSLYAREEEAKRIAHELHDEAGQITAAIHLALAEVALELPPSGRERLRRIGGLIEGVEERLRQLSHELRPSILDDLGLSPALAFLANGFSARTRVAVQVKGSTGGRLDPLVETALYRIVQEALANVGKHARATRADITLSRERGRLVCAVRDDGVGFEHRPVRRRVGRATGLGLLGIRERLGALNGQMQILSSRGEGTELRVSVPLRPR
jgi:signal transduction histidine kinase